MPRYRAYGRSDEPPQFHGDRGFIGVNMRVDPSQLEPGYAAAATNMRFTKGVAETRLGFIKPPWCNKIDGGNVQPWGTVYGIGQFKDPTTLEDYLVIAADGSLYATVENNVATSLSVPSGENLAVDCTFTQAFDTMIMHRGSTLDALRMPFIQTGFEQINQSLEGTGTYAIPRAARSIFFQNRLVIPFGNDEVALSDFNDYTRYAAVEQAFRINQGSSDRIVTIAKFNDTTLIVLKERSIYAVNNVYGNLAAAQLDLITDRFGCVAAKSVVHVGSDLLFLSQLGVMSIRQTEDNKLQAVVQPLSEPVQPLIDRINWQYASSAVGAYWNNRYYLAVPLDDAEVLGPELALNQSTYNESDPFEATVQNLVAGATYRYIKGPTYDVSYTNGSTTSTQSGDFVAAGTTLLLTGSNEGAIGASLKRVYKGVNNAVLVHDFLNGAWSGYDEGEDLTVKEFFLFPVRGRDRLLFVSHDGWINVYEEDYEDQISYPTVTVAVASQPSNGNSITVNSGDTATADTSAATNSGTNWGCNSLSAAQQNIHNQSPASNSFSPFAGTQWSAPDTYPYLSQTGTVVFYSTNGSLPDVDITGSWATVTYQTHRPIVSTLITRGYNAPELSLSEFKWLSVDQQTWAPQFTISAITSGANEVTVLVEDETKDVTAYYRPFDKAPFQWDNANDDFNTKWREDYSIRFTSTNDGIDPQDGIPCDLHQEVRERYRLPPLEGRSMQIKIVNETGRIRVQQLTLETSNRPDRAGVKA